MILSLYLQLICLLATVITYDELVSDIEFKTFYLVVLLIIETLVIHYLTYKIEFKVNWIIVLLSLLPISVITLFI